MESVCEFKAKMHLLIQAAESEAGATFDNCFFDNCFGFLQQCKNRSFLGSVFVHATGRRQN